MASEIQRITTIKKVDVLADKVQFETFIEAEITKIRTKYQPALDKLNALLKEFDG